MKPIDQTTFGDGASPADKREPGNCLQACVASVFDLPLDHVPDFCGTDPGASAYWLDLERWLRPMGLLPICIDLDISAAFVPFGYTIGMGRSARGVRHAMVCLDGTTVHDPHPSRDGLAECSAHIVFAVLDPTQERRKE